MKYIIFIILLFSFLSSRSITIASASNLYPVFVVLEEEFRRKYPSINLKIIYGSSGRLTSQIENGAPYDIFMSANIEFLNRLYKNKKAVTKPKIYALGTLIYLTRLKNINFNKKNFLFNHNIQRIAIANPKLAPYGKASMEILNNLNILNRIKDKIIYGDSISQTLFYIIKSVDVGIVAKSFIYNDYFKKNINRFKWKDIDKRLYKPIKQSISILQNGTNNKYVKIFYDFILDESIKPIFNKFGYL